MDKIFFIQVLVAALATVGIVEVIKNFYKPKEKKNYVFVAVPTSIANFCIVFFLPLWVSGCLLVVGAVQISYQTIMQSYNVIIEALANKIKSI